MNRLFNDFFRKFAGVILDVFVTSWGWLCRCFGRNFE